jgi:hypothetical protein
MRCSLTNRNAWWSWPVALACCVGAAELRLTRGDEQQPAAAAPAAADKPAPADVATLLVTAMRNNPDIAVSQADVEEAEAELNRVRLNVAREVVAARAEVASQRYKVAYTQQLRQKQVVGMGEVRLEEGKAESLEADLKYLVGGVDLRFEEKDEKGVRIETKDGIVAAATTWTEMGLPAMLTTAMEKNPDIVLAKAKLRGAQAALNRTRLNVARQVITLKDSVHHLQLAANGARQLFEKAVVQEPTLTEALAKLSEAQAELQYVLGGPDLPELPKASEPPGRSP